MSRMGQVEKRVEVLYGSEKDGVHQRDNILDVLKILQSCSER